jgi:hypothetical protein
MPAIFISHSSLDQQIAKHIKTALDQFGFPDHHHRWSIF